MKKDLQKLAKAIKEQRKVAIFVACVLTYVVAIILVKTNAFAKTPSLDLVRADVAAVKLPSVVEAKETELVTVEADLDLQDKAEYYENLYGPKPEPATVTVNGYEFDYIPGAPYSVYESMARAMEVETETETVYIPNEEYYSENSSNTETGSITSVSTEEPTVEETEAPAEDEEMMSEFIEAAYTPGELRYHGVLYWNDHKWTWYSEKVLPGGGLDIPGRYTDDDGFVCDENGYICLAADPSYIANGTVIDTPFGRPGKIYDSGCAYGTVDVYVGW